MASLKICTGVNANNLACLLAQSSSDLEASTGLDLIGSLVHLKQNTTMHVDSKAN